MENQKKILIVSLSSLMCFAFLASSGIWSKSPLSSEMVTTPGSDPAHPIALPDTAPSDTSATNELVTLSGTFLCLPHKDTTGPQTEECAFGFKVAETYYAINFGQNAERMEQFSSGASITAQGFVTPIETLSTDMWQKYPIVGIFTITDVLDETTE